MVLKAYQKRVVDEKEDLDIKLVKLREFVYGDPKFDEVNQLEQSRLFNQVVAMQTYSNILGERIRGFPIE